MSGLGKATAAQQQAADRAKAIEAAMAGNGQPTPKVTLSVNAGPKQ